MNMKRTYTLLLFRYYRSLRAKGGKVAARLEIRVPTLHFPGQEEAALADIRDPKMRTTASIGLFLTGAAPSQNRVRLAGSQIGVVTLEWAEGLINYFVTLTVANWSLSTADELQDFAEKTLTAVVSASFRLGPKVEWLDHPRILGRPEIFTTPI